MLAAYRGARRRARRSPPPDGRRAHRLALEAAARAPATSAPWFEAATPGSPRIPLQHRRRALRPAGLPAAAGAGARRGPGGASRPMRALFDDDKLAAFLVLRDAASIAAAPQPAAGPALVLRRRTGDISRLYGALDAGRRRSTPTGCCSTPCPASCGPRPIGRHGGAVRRARRACRRSTTTPASSSIAPVLIVPRVFEPELCRRLIALYEAEGGAAVRRDARRRRARPSACWTTSSAAAT